MNECQLHVPSAQDAPGNFGWVGIVVVHGSASVCVYIPASLDGLWHAKYCLVSGVYKAPENLVML